MSMDIPLPDFDSIPKAGGLRDVRRVRSHRVSNGVKIPILPYFDRGDETQRISRDTMADLIRGVWDNYFDAIFIIDCRYAYEYKGGHIAKAKNLNEPMAFRKMFFESPIKRAVIIFHCELSHDRAPKMAKLFRNFDRVKNEENWPFLDYTDTYVLDGGYRDFYEKYQDLCDGGYVQMRDNKHTLNGDLVKANSYFKLELEKVNDENRANRQRAMLEKKQRSNVREFTSPIRQSRKQRKASNLCWETARRSLDIRNF